MDGVASGVNHSEDFDPIPDFEPTNFLFGEGGF
jgi:hypothetical protein